ncbi:hypothetical protein GH733_019654 [Mirounga leonina]|nr:hypothetical protein GH733_019668 [Mirounga leonina]KAF3812364.1 hypothetical protein GH733_019654 [Mirounga leonina]
MPSGTPVFLSPEVMARGLLWLGLVLLGALQAQAQDSPPELIPAPFLTKIPLQPDFQDDQGKWYVIGVAGNSINTEKRAQLKMYTTTYQLKDNRSYNVTSTLISSLPGQFTLGNIKRYVGVQSYTVQVMTTNYNQFAMVFFKKVYKNQEYFKITLYGRTKQLPTALKEYFTGFAKSLGLTDDHIIFPVPTGNCQRRRGEGDMGTVRA